MVGISSNWRPREQILLTVIWLRQYLMHDVLGFLFGVTYPTVGRIIKRVLPLLKAAGRDTMRLPDPGKKHRRTLAALLADTPELPSSSTRLNNLSGYLCHPGA